MHTPLVSLIFYNLFNLFFVGLFTKSKMLKSELHVNCVCVCIQVTIHAPVHAFIVNIIHDRAVETSEILKHHAIHFIHSLAEAICMKW